MSEMTFDNAALALAELLELDRQIAALEAERKRVVTAATASLSAEITDLGDSYDAVWQPFLKWAKANKAALTKDGERKTFRMPTGRIEFRMGRQSVEILDEAHAARALAHAGLTEYLGVSKAAVLKWPDPVELLDCGVIVGRSADVVRVTPLQSDAADPQPEGVK